MSFAPRYTVTPETARHLMSIEAAKQALIDLPVTPGVLAGLRQTARIQTTHYSTQIEGNRLEEDQVEQVLHGKQHFPGRERDEAEIKGYYAALQELESRVARHKAVSEQAVSKRRERRPGKAKIVEEAEFT